MIKMTCSGTFTLLPKGAKWSLTIMAHYTIATDVKNVNNSPLTKIMKYHWIRYNQIAYMAVLNISLYIKYEHLTQNKIISKLLSIVIIVSIDKEFVDCHGTCYKDGKELISSRVCYFWLSFSLQIRMAYNYSKSYVSCN